MPGPSIGSPSGARRRACRRLVREHEGEELALLPLTRLPRQNVFPPAPAGKDDESLEGDSSRLRAMEHEHEALASNVLAGSATDVSESKRSIVAGATAQMFSLTRVQSPSHMARSTVRKGIDRKIAV